MKIGKMVALTNRSLKSCSLFVGLLTMVLAAGACQTRNTPKKNSEVASTNAANALCWPWSSIEILKNAYDSGKNINSCEAKNKDIPGYSWQTCQARRQRDLCDIWEKASACMNAAGQTGGMSSDWQANQGQTTGDEGATSCINEPKDFITDFNKNDMNVCFYTDVEGQGESFCSNGGLIPNLPAKFRYKISSIIFSDAGPEDRIEVHLFRKSGYRGEERILTLTGQNTLKGFNDKAASLVIDRVKVLKDGTCKRTYFKSGPCSEEVRL